MILRRSLIVSAVPFLLPRVALARRPWGSGGSGTQFSPDGFRISRDGSVINSRWGTWTVDPTFTGGPVYYVLLNGRRVAECVAPQGSGPAIGPVPGSYGLQIDHGGQIYSWPSGDLEWQTFINYSWVPNSCFGDCSFNTGNPSPTTGAYSFPSYSPPYTPSADGTTVTAPTGTVTNQDGVWGFGSVNTDYGGYDLTLNGIPFGDNRGEGSDAGPVTNVNAWGCTAITVSAHGQVFITLPSSLGFRCMAGLQGNPCTAIPGTVAVPVGLSFTTAGSFVYPALPFSSTIGTAIGSLTMQLSDGSSRAPSDAELTVIPQGGAMSPQLSYTSPTLFTNQTFGSQQSTPMVLQVTVNGSSYCLAFTVFYYA